MSVFNLLDNHIGYPLSSFSFEHAALQIDQLVQMNVDTQKYNNAFMQDYIRNWLAKIFVSIQKSIAIENQVGEEKKNQILFCDEILKFKQIHKIKYDPVEYLIVFPFTEAGIEPEKSNYLKGIKKFAKSLNISVKTFFQAPDELDWNQGQLNDEDYFLVFPTIFDENNIYNTAKLEYINSISSLIAALTKQTPEKKILLAYEFLEHFDEFKKRKFYRSFIRNFLAIKYRRYDLNLYNVSLLMNSNDDVELFNSVLSEIIKLLEYNSPLNSIKTLEEFISNHPYIKDGSIEEGTTISFKKKNELSKKQIFSTKRDVKFVEELQLDVKTEDSVFLQELIKIHSVKDLKESILLLGESGVGKTEIARTIHLNSRQLHSKTKFVAINCAAIPSELIESELFGFARGAHSTARYGFEGKIKSADSGTLFLDEIGKAPLNVQAKLLKFIDEKKFYSVGSNEEKKVDARIIFATNEDPLNLIRKGLMLPDFYYRISKLKFTIPPLRERPKDLRNFISYFKRLCEADFNISLQLTDEALKYMLSLQWPGNIRQIENTLYQLYVECKVSQLSEITKSIVEKYIEKIPTDKNTISFTNFEHSYRSFFEYWRSIKDEFNLIEIGDAENKKTNKNKNKKSFLKLVIEPIAANTYKSMSLDVTKASEVLGLSLGSGKKYSPFYNQMNLYPKIKRAFEKLEN